MVRLFHRSKGKVNSLIKDGHSFIVVESDGDESEVTNFISHILKDDAFSYNYYFNKLISPKRESYFGFYETLEFNIGAPIPKGVFTKDSCMPRIGQNLQIMKCYQKTRGALEFNISLESLNNLLNDTTSEVFGKKIISDEKIKHIRNILKSTLVAKHIDVKNEKNGQWERIDTIYPSKISCRIM